MVPDHPQSYHRYMREALLDHVNLPAEQVHIPDGTVQRAHVAAHCAAYEAAIDELGGIGSPDSRSRAQRPHRVQRAGLDRRVPHPPDRARCHHPPGCRRRLRLGGRGAARGHHHGHCATILDAAEVVLVASGPHKATTIWRVLEEEISPQLPATYLRRHRNVTLYLDEEAGGGRAVGRYRPTAKKKATHAPEGGGPPHALATRSQGIYSLCSSPRCHHMA